MCLKNIEKEEKDSFWNISFYVFCRWFGEMETKTKVEILSLNSISKSLCTWEVVISKERSLLYHTTTKYNFMTGKSQKRWKLCFNWGLFVTSRLWSGLAIFHIKWMARTWVDTSKKSESFKIRMKLNPVIPKLNMRLSKNTYVVQVPGWPQHDPWSRPAHQLWPSGQFGADSMHCNENSIKNTQTNFMFLWRYKIDWLNEEAMKQWKSLTYMAL